LPQETEFPIPKHRKYDEQPSIRHIVFDIGKVLIHYDPHIPYRRLIPDDA
jgi:hypothetical protein